MSLLLKRWRCVDDEILILTEEDYRVHTAMHPSHRIVADENTRGEQGKGVYVRFESLSGFPLSKLGDSSESI
jgi:hypothetical protein